MNASWLNTNITNSILDINRVISTFQKSGGTAPSIGAKGRKPVILQTAECSLRATVFLADQQEGTSCTTDEIAEGTQVP